MREVLKKKLASFFKAPKEKYKQQNNYRVNLIFYI